MYKKSKKILSLVLALMFLVTIAGSVFTKTVSADEYVHGAHKDIATFQKNFCLTPEQKKYCITQTVRAVNIVTDPTMSDLEKYYRLALWENDRATYDFDFWNGGYDFKYYRHQWDAYGVLTDTSVCAGIAIYYATLCHAAGLPCKFVRTDPDFLDHTINYIPNINDNAYLVDVTEASFLMSQYCDNSFGDCLDKEFAYITKDPTDQTFEYVVESKSDFPEEEPPIVESVFPSNIKDCFNTTYTDWFNEFALHQDTTKTFKTEYVEKGSGLRGVHYASYKDYPKQFSDSEKPGIWFLEDFYEDPTEVESLIRNRTFNEQLLVPSGIDGNYDCDTASELEQQLEFELNLEYFPSLKDGEIVPEPDSLWSEEDYDIECTAFNKEEGKALVTVMGTGKYNGSATFEVKLGPDVDDEEEDNPVAPQPSLDDLTVAIQSLANAINTQNSTQIGDLQKQVATLQKKLDEGSKKSNTLKVKGKKVTLKHKTLKKKSKTLKIDKAIKFLNKGQGTRVYAKTSGNKNITVNSNTGKITVNKKLKKGTYKVKVKVIAVGNNSYHSSTWKTATITVRVK